MSAFSRAGSSAPSDMLSPSASSPSSSSSTPNKKPMDPARQARLAARQVRNRQSAQNSRNRKKAEREQLETEVVELRQRNLELEGRVSDMGKELSALMDVVKILMKSQPTTDADQPSTSQAASVPAASVEALADPLSPQAFVQHLARSPFLSDLSSIASHSSAPSLPTTLLSSSPSSFSSSSSADIRRSSLSHPPVSHRVSLAQKPRRSPSNSDGDFPTADVAGLRGGRGGRKRRRVEAETCHQGSSIIEQLSAYEGAAAAAGGTGSGAGAQGEEAEVSVVGEDAVARVVGQVGGCEGSAADEVAERQGGKQGCTIQGDSNGSSYGADDMGEANHSLAGQLLAVIFGERNLEAAQSQGRLSAPAQAMLTGKNDEIKAEEQGQGGVQAVFDFGLRQTQQDVALTPPSVEEQDEIMASIFNMADATAAGSNSEASTAAEYHQSDDLSVTSASPSTTAWDYEALGLDLGLDLSVDIDVPHNKLLTSDKPQEGPDDSLPGLDNFFLSNFIKSEPVSSS
ncbi:hypothetical protein BDZ90DRAFT_277776 [Jaminaea rosea]|uniref:BZIP domain-containing protein n=1 Tax=Jaminaea rosea TaxID=1569628 RepID=A0A316UW37_9BASI|nr:hypothetical protein BDZ90DRAFT_277776 [Jaminaea rosea]PWN29506.1 hypothetical protein BDZ90DRAFT_277776 [Jaminaea rosea]